MKYISNEYIKLTIDKIDIIINPSTPFNLPIGTLTPRTYAIVYNNGTRDIVFILKPGTDIIIKDDKEDKDDDINIDSTREKLISIAESLGLTVTSKMNKTVILEMIQGV